MTKNKTIGEVLDNTEARLRELLKDNRFVDPEVCIMVAFKKHPNDKKVTASYATSMDPRDAAHMMEMITLREGTAAAETGKLIGRLIG